MFKIFMNLLLASLLILLERWIHRLMTKRIMKLKIRQLDLERMLRFHRSPTPKTVERTEVES